MKCNICGKKISMVFSRQIYLEQRPTEDYCKKCFKILLSNYDKLVERMRKKYELKV